jgi:predicted esterase
LLMQYGQADPIVPIAEVRRLYQQVKAQYTHPERIELVEYPAIAHETPPAMFVRAAQWFDQFLKKGTGL